MIALQCSVWAPRVGFFALGRGQMWLGGTPTCTRMYTSLLPPLPALACGDNTSRPHMHTHAPPPSAPTDAAHCSPRRAEAGVPHSCHCRCPCARRCPHLRPYPPGPTLSLSLPLPLLAAQFRRRCGTGEPSPGADVGAALSASVAKCAGRTEELGCEAPLHSAAANALSIAQPAQPDCEACVSDTYCTTRPTHVGEASAKAGDAEREGIKRERAKWERPRPKRETLSGRGCGACVALWNVLRNQPLPYLLRGAEQR
jgi:hypothetical protein